MSAKSRRSSTSAVRGLKKLAVQSVKPRVGPVVWDRLADPLDRDPKRRRARLARLEAARRSRDLETMDLTALAQHFGTDKWGSHRYTPHYARHLAHLRDRRFTLLELGIGGYAKSERGGASLRMWQQYFPRATIVGLDLQDKSFVEGPRIKVYQGSQTDPVVLDRIIGDVGTLDVIIDDGSHHPPHIRQSFAYLFPRLADDGLYVIEDTQTSYWPNWGGSENLHDPGTSMALVKDLVDGLTWEEFVDDEYVPTYADEHVIALHAYHNLVILEKGVNREGSRSSSKRRAVKAADPSRPFGTPAQQRAAYSLPADVPGEPARSAGEQLAQDPAEQQPS